MPVFSRFRATLRSLHEKAIGSINSWLDRELEKIARLTPKHEEQWTMFWEWDIGERKRFGSEFPRLSFGQARRVWSEMEQVFFAHYEDFLRVWPEWGSSGIWSIPYPGSRNAGKMVDYSLLPLPDALVGRFKAWQAEFESVPPGSDEGLDDAFFAVAYGLARDLKQCVGPSVYVERRELVEIMMDGTARSCRPLLGLPEGE